MTARNQVLVPSLSLVRCVRSSLKRRRKEKIHSIKFLLFILLYVCVCVFFFYFVFVFSSSYVCHTHNLLVLCPLLMQWATRRSCLYAGRSGSAWYTLRPCIFLIYKYILIIQFRLVFVEWNVCLFAVAFQAIFSLFFFVSRGFVGKSGRWLMEKRRKKKIQSSISRVLGNHKDTRANSNGVGGCLHASHPVRRLRCFISFLMHTAADEFLVVHMMQCTISCSTIFALYSTCFFSTN